MICNDVGKVILDNNIVTAFPSLTLLILDGFFLSNCNLGSCIDINCELNALFLLYYQLLTVIVYNVFFLFAPICF